MTIKTKTLAAMDPKELDKLLEEFLATITDETPKVHFSQSCTIPPTPPANGGLIEVKGQKVQAAQWQVVTVFSVLIMYQAVEEREPIV